jgi:hypothetical protein
MGWECGYRKRTQHRSALGLSRNHLQGNYSIGFVGQRMRITDGLGEVQKQVVGRVELLHAGIPIIA